MSERDLRRYSSGSTFERDIGYCRAVADGQLVHVSGTTGYDYDTMTIATDARAQAEQCIVNIKNALAQFDCALTDVLRVRYLFVDRADFPACWPVFKDAFGDAPPAATFMVVGLYDEAMRLEVEVTARQA